MHNIDARALVLGFVASHPLFDGLDPRRLAGLAEGFELRELRAGDVLLTPGQANEHLYMLVAGALRVRLDRVDSADGFAVAVGELIGDISIVDGRTASAFVVAEQPSRVLAIHQDLLWGVLLPIPLVARNFMRLVAERFRARSRVMHQALEQQLRLEQMQRELAIARDIQMSMLPASGPLCARFPGVDLHAEMVPAREVGGDFYDLFPVDGRRLCLAVGDVSGKGVPAALFMVRAMTQLRAEVLAHRGLERALGNLNRALCRDNPTGMFITLNVAVLDARSGRLEYVNAGHDEPLLYQGGDWSFLPQPPGILAGVEETAVFGHASVELGDGDALVFYTDGVNEAFNPDKECFGRGRLISALRAEGTDAPAADLAASVTRALQGFVAGEPPSDDLTLLAVRLARRGGAGSAA
jgi:sigma-B regulation protein RsbU (phosphoserine phosphatase)